MFETFNESRSIAHSRVHLTDQPTENQASDQHQKIKCIQHKDKLRRSAIANTFLDELKLIVNIYDEFNTTSSPDHSVQSQEKCLQKHTTKDQYKTSSVCDLDSLH